LSDWVELNTPVDALFLAPVDWSLFRVYALRSLVVTWKGTGWAEWAKNYDRVRNLYDNPMPQDFVAAAREYGVDYIVVMSDFALPEMDNVYQNEYYVIYKTR
jgi:hypothetical protein